VEEKMQEVSPIEIAKRISSGEGLLIVDVRTPGEYGAIHAESAINIPLESISEETLQKEAQGRTVAFICKGGTRSKRACQAVTCNALSVVGGTDAWVNAGLPVVRGKGVISLERQVRIAAGILVLLGVAGSFLLHPALLGISAFVGAGLVFAGVTDWCGMGLLLAKMPWNCGKCS
jgi:rhodanese-related sulfurtransferase